MFKKKGFRIFFLKNFFFSLILDLISIWGCICFLNVIVWNLSLLVERISVLVVNWYFVDETRIVEGQQFICKQHTSPFLRQLLLKFKTLYQRLSCREHSSPSLLLSVPKSCPTLCDLMDCSMPCFPALHYLLQFVQIRVHP